MSDAPEPATDKRPTSEASQRWPASRVVFAAVVGVLLVSLGYAIGVRSPWTAHHPRIASGTAERVPGNVPFGYFDPDEGGRVAFRLDDVVWESAEGTGSGSVPPCLRDVGQPLAVEVGLMEVARPFGSGSYWRVLSVTCPTG